MREAVGVQPPFETVACGDVQMALSRRGTGSPVLCLSATGHGGRDFEAFTRMAMAGGFEVVALDWPGHGASPDQPPGFQASAMAYATLLEDLIPRLWPAGQAPIILGNSIGGAAAIVLAARRPALARALVLCNPGGLARLNWIGRLYIAHMVRFFRKGAAGAPSFPRAFARYYRGILKLEPAAAQRDRIAAAGREMAPVLAQAWTSFGTPAADVRFDVPKLACPVLYAWARNDRIVSWRASRKAALSAPDHRVRLFPGGHSPFLEAPEAFFGEFQAFVRQSGDQANDR